MSRKIQISNHYSLEELQVLLPKVQNLEMRFRMLVIERILSNPKYLEMRYVNHFIFHLIHCIVGLDGTMKVD